MGATNPRPPKKDKIAVSFWITFGISMALITSLIPLDYLITDHTTRTLVFTLITFLSFIFAAISGSILVTPNTQDKE